MNRAERRHPTKARQVQRIMDDLDKVAKIKQTMDWDWPVKPGDKVRLNMEAITRAQEYGRWLPAYRAFCENNSDRIFTAEYVEGMSPSVVCFAEDESTPKWLFWVGDLEAVKSRS